MVLESNSIMNMVLESTRNMVLEENCICVEVPQLAIQSGARIPTTPLNTFEYIQVHPNTSEYNQWKPVKFMKFNWNECGQKYFGIQHEYKYKWNSYEINVRKLYFEIYFGIQQKYKYQENSFEMNVNKLTLEFSMNTNTNEIHLKWMWRNWI